MLYQIPNRRAKCNEIFPGRSLHGGDHVRSRGSDGEGPTPENQLCTRNTVQARLSHGHANLDFGSALAVILKL